MRYLLYGAVMMALGVPAHAAEITTYMWEGLQMIGIDGEIAPNDFEAFKAKANQLAVKPIVVLQSPGGSLVDGLQIGEFVRLKGWPTFVPGGLCASACADIWLAGTPRMMMPDAKVGFHAANLKGEVTSSGSGNALLGAYFNRIGLNYEAIVWLTTATPNEIAFLTPAKAAELGIDIIVPQKQAAVQPAPAPVPAPTPAPASMQSLLRMLGVSAGRDCSRASEEVRIFFPFKFSDCDPATIAKSDPATTSVRESGYRTVKSWDSLQSDGRYILRMLQVREPCTDPRFACYRLIATDHDAAGNSEGGSVCWFSKDRSDCETTASEHYALKPGSIAAFLKIANGGLPK